MPVVFRDVDVNVNELSHRLICTELLKENQVAPRDGSANAGRQPRNSIKSGRRPASRAQAYSQESTTTSTITSTSTSTLYVVPLRRLIAATRAGGLPSACCQGRTG